MMASPTTTRFALGDGGRLAATAFLMLLIVAFSTRDPVLLALYSLIACGIVLANVELLSGMTGKERDMAVILFVALTVVLPVSAFRNASAFAHYTGILVSFGVAYVLTRNLSMYLTASRLSLLAAQSAVVIYLCFSGLDDFPLEDMLPDSSSNGVTSYLVLLQANYCIVNFLLRRRVSIATSAVTLGICIVGYGRGSLLAAGAILALNLIFSVSVKSRMHTAIGAVVLSCVAVGVYVGYGDNITSFIELNTKISAGLEDQPRELIIDAYLGRMDAISVLVGADWGGTVIELDYYGNPHISYIRAHHIFGLAYLLAMLALPFVLLSKKHPASVIAFCSLMLAVILFRSSTEPILFPTLLDLYYFAICFALGRSPRKPAFRVPRRVS